jgi:hypothetical protein
MSKAIHREKVARHVSVAGEIAVHEALLEGRFHGRRRVLCTLHIISFFCESCVVAWEVFRPWKGTYAPLHWVIASSFPCCVVKWICVMVEALGYVFGVMVYLFWGVRVIM